jgi:catechol 2,3-dioxygenase-like lactoylglutathione lyase family enzyme
MWWLALTSNFSEWASYQPDVQRTLLSVSCQDVSTRMIQLISAVTFAVRDMARSIEFYKKLGFELLYGGESAAFSSLKAGEAFVNLVATPGYQGHWWGRVIFRMVDVDGLHRAFTAVGLKPESPMDAAWGERFFHIHDPDGHEISFAEILSKQS